MAAVKSTNQDSCCGWDCHQHHEAVMNRTCFLSALLLIALPIDVSLADT
jgi:hypothetical protein